MTCFHGNTFCIEGGVDHATCQSPLLTVYVPGFRGPIPTLDAQIMDLDDGLILHFSGDAHSGVGITPAKLRAVVANVRDRLPRLLALADQFEAITASKVAT